MSGESRPDEPACNSPSYTGRMEYYEEFSQLSVFLTPIPCIPVAKSQCVDKNPYLHSTPHVFHPTKGLREREGQPQQCCIEPRHDGGRVSDPRLLLLHENAVS